jgi:SAM-dependent methyltransferase
MNQVVLNWGRKYLGSLDIAGKSVLEIGAYNINGTIRDVVMPLTPASYVGVDLVAGPGVDEICDACHLVDVYGSKAFEVIIACSLLSYIKDWRSAISNMKQVCKSKGILFIVTVSRWQYRTFGDDTRDYWRFSARDLRHIFSDCLINVLEEQQGRHSLICIKAEKPSSFSEVDLTNYAVTVASSQAAKYGHAHYKFSHPV